jgi:hypothetical protein
MGIVRACTSLRRCHTLLLSHGRVGHQDMKYGIHVSRCMPDSLVRSCFESTGPLLFGNDVFFNLEDLLAADPIHKRLMSLAGPCFGHMALPLLYSGGVLHSVSLHLCKKCG